MLVRIYDENKINEVISKADDNEKVAGYYVMGIC